MMCNDNSNDRLWMFMIYVKREGREGERKSNSCREYFALVHGRPPKS